jgi:FixJ family two-component response regulator
VTDQAMPGMTGAELAEAARALRPGLPVLLATGTADLPPGVGAGLPRLSKPYAQDDLAAALDRLAPAGDDREAGRPRRAAAAATREEPPPVLQETR